MPRAGGDVARVAVDEPGPTASAGSANHGGLPSERHFGMDWLRIVAFGVLILFHVGLAFGPWGYELKFDPTYDWVAVPMLFTSTWRLPLLFVVSGFASGALLQRAPSVSRFARERLSRLGIPVLFGMAVLVTPQPWVALVTQHDYPHGFIHFMIHDYYRFQEIDGILMPTWMHLWFVVYLLVYSLLLVALLAWGGRLVRTLGRAFERVLATAAILPLPMLTVFAVRYALPPGWMDTHGLVDDWSAHAVYFPCFLFGLLVQRSATIRSTIARWWKIALVVGLIAYLGIAACELRWPGKTPLPKDWIVPFNLLRSVQMWAMVIGLIGAADAHLNRDHRWRTTLAEAVFPVYIIHQTIILVVGYWLLGTDTGAPTRFVILVAATVGGCWLFYLVGRRIGWLRPLIGLRRRPKARVTSEDKP